MKPLVHIYTDGACSKNPGPGGWAALLRFEKQEKTVSGFEPQTTNNRMELMAALMALKALKKPCQVILSTDSQYVQKGITQWIWGWKKRNWILKNGTQVQNRDLWEALLAETLPHDIDWQWVRGHNGHPENERVDELARKAIQRG